MMVYYFSWCLNSNLWSKSWFRVTRRHICYSYCRIKLIDLQFKTFIFSLCRCFNNLVIEQSTIKSNCELLYKCMNRRTAFFLCFVFENFNTRNQENLKCNHVDLDIWSPTSFPSSLSTFSLFQAWFWSVSCSWKHDKIV